MRDKDRRPRKLPRILRVLHWIIILNFVLEIIYGGYMVFVVMAPEGASGPLWMAARDMPPDRLLVRRAYAIETWIAITGLSLYVAITEFLPRLCVIVKKD